MQQCPSCQHVQQQGNFCSKCGTQTVYNEQLAATVETPKFNESTVNYQEKVGQLKQISGGYFSQFMALLKNPTQAHMMNAGKLFSTVSFVLYLAIISFTIYSLLNNLYSSTIGSFSSFGVEESIPFIVCIALFLVLAIFTVVSIIILVVLAKVFGVSLPFGKLFGQVTNFYPSLIVISLAAFILQVISFQKLSTLLVLVAIFIALFLIPLYVMVYTLKTAEAKIDVYYAYLILGAVITAVLYVVFSSMLSTLIDAVLEEVQNNFW